MFDLFGRKARAELATEKACVKALSQEFEALRDDFAKANQRIRELADSIREYDQAIYNISQCAPDWNRMRPIFNQMQVGQESRMKAESNRIGSILRTELLDVYGGKNIKTPRIERKPIS